MKESDFCILPHTSTIVKRPLDPRRPRGELSIFLFRSGICLLVVTCTSFVGASPRIAIKSMHPSKRSDFLLATTAPFRYIGPPFVAFTRKPSCAKMPSASFSFALPRATFVCGASQRGFGFVCLARQPRRGGGAVLEAPIELEELEFE